MQNKNNRLPYILGIACTFAVNDFSWQHPFFWDTLLTSTITQYYYDHGFGNLILPLTMDAGHPPLFYVYVTCFYKLLGKSLFAAHLSMLPFTILGIVSFLKITEYFLLSLIQRILATFGFFAIPAILSQYSLVSYDAVLLSCFLMSLWAILQDKKWLLFFALMVLVGVSLRGVVELVALAFMAFYFNQQKFKKHIWCFVIPLLIAGIWYFYHYTHTGWFLSTPNRGWLNQRGLADAHQWLKNGVSVLRCFVDMGIVILSVLVFVLFLLKKIEKRFLALILIPFVLLTLSFLPFTNPINHRYYLPVYVLLLLTVLYALNTYNFRWSLLSIMLLFVGNWMIYPVPISNAWDCTFLHQDYFSCKKNMLEQIELLHLDKTKIGTTFPLDVSLKQSDMQDDTLRMQNVNDHAIDSLYYVLFSNVCNDFSDEQIQQLKGWTKIYHIKNKTVYMDLYAR